MKDEGILMLLKNDPERGMEELIRKYSGLVCSVIRGRIPIGLFCEADVEACAADSFSEFYLSLDKYDPEKAGIRTWLCIIARNNAADLVRNRMRDAGNVSLDDENALAVPDDFSLEGSFEDSEQRRELIAAIKELGSPDSEILIMKYYLRLPSKRIAHELRLSVSNVDTRAHRAIARLRKRLGGLEQ